MATELNRRKLLQRMAQLSLGASLLSAPAVAHALLKRNDSARANNYLLLGCTKQQDKYQLSAMFSNGELPYQLALPARGHHVALAKKDHGLAACVGRRPGHYIVLFEPRTGQLLGNITPPANMHFYGHACFSDDASKLYVTAGDSDTSQGAVLVYQQQPERWSLSQRWPIAGLGPHQLLMLPKQRLVVAVGGIHTQGREKLNLETMRPALVYLDSETGQALLTRELPDNQLSIRHLCYSTHSDTAWLACQGQNPQREVRSLVYSQHAMEPCMALDADADYWPLFNHYIGSIECVDGTLLASSPRGGKLAVWSETERELAQLMQVDDVCGLATHAKGWVASTGQGQLIQKAQPIQRLQTALQWDNHLSVLDIS
ncbi:DUF1513 domain-containing protein [Agarivorans sp. MS3-6]